MARAVGLEVNINQTKTTTTIIFCLTDVRSNLWSFCYLGCTNTTDGGADEDVDCRINKARAAFGRMYAVWSSSQISRRTKLRIFNACVKSVLLYGSETWLVSNSITQRLQTFVNKCLRIICRIFWPNTISNVALLKLTDEEPILRQIKRRKWRWIGHTLRKPPDSISRMALKEAEDVVDLSTPGEDRFAAKTNECRHHMGRREKNCTESYSMEEPC